MKFKIFISSTRQEFVNEREYLKREIESDYVLNQMFDVFTFEQTHASTKSPLELYTEQVVNSDIYIGLIGSDYGSILESGISPTEHEYNLFNKSHNDALIYIKDNVVNRDEKTKKFIARIKNEHSYKKFNNIYDLFDEVKKSLVEFIKKNLKNYKSFDREVIMDSSCSDVDLEAINLFFKKLDYTPLKELKEKKGIEKVLSGINAGEYVNGEFKLNNAGALFFAKDITKFDIPHEVKMVRFRDNDGLKVFEKETSHESLLNLIIDVEKFVYDNTHKISEIKGFERKTKYDYPIEAIREALVNSLAHRDYGITTSPITVYIYRDRIEIKSPGRLPYPLKVSDLENNDPIRRNETICSIFSNTSYMEHIGTGIRRMKEISKEHGIEEPEIIEDGEFLKVIFRKNRAEYDMLNERQISLLKRMKASDEITISKYMKIFDVSRNTASDDLNHLFAIEYVDKIPNGKKSIFKKM